MLKYFLMIFKGGECVDFLIIVGFLPIFLVLFLSKNTFASQKNIYISRVYATNGREFVEIFNSGEDYRFQEILSEILKSRLKLRILKTVFLNLRVILLFHKMRQAQIQILKMNFKM